MVTMIATPVRWLLMAGVAACGCFMIASNKMTDRALAFMVSVLLWQAHYIVMMWEADWMRNAGTSMQKRDIARLKEAPNARVESQI